MLTLFRWLLLLTVGLITGLVLLAALIWYFAVRSLPDYDANFAVEGIAAPVEIVRSTDNVPHIFGQSDADVFFALGVAHAQDRLFQMTVLRRAAQGRLSEIYGAGSFAADDLARRMEFRRLGQAALAAQEPAAMAALEAYAAGVNQWIGQVNEGARGRGAPEFFLYPDDISYWTPADSLAILKLFAAASTTAITDEVNRARLSLADPAKGPQLLAHPGDAALASYADLFPGARLLLNDGSGQMPGPRAAAMSGFVAPGLGISGTGFAVAPARTAAGGAILAHDAQSLLTAPGLFYLARLELASGGVIGATIPGLPAVLSGRNPTLAWGLTPAGADDADILIEEVQPGDNGRYRGLTGWTPFDTRREIIHIRDAADQAITLRHTENGPLLPGSAFGLAHVTPVGHVAAIRWAGAVEDDASFSALIGLMMAPDRAAGARALAGLVAPTAEITLADDSGVAGVVAGRLPIRAEAAQTGGRMPAPGWIAGNRWAGLQPAAEAIGAAAGDGPVVTATGESPPGGPARPRMDRLTRLMDSREIHSRDSLIAAQLDVVSPVARAVLPLVGADLWFTDEPAPPGTPERQRQDALALLAEWDGEMNEHLPEPLIYATWMARLQTRLIRDDLGPLADEMTGLQPAFIEAVFRNRGGAGAWCDVVQSAPVETCATVARQALDAAILDLTERFGPDVTSWRWGDPHATRQVSPGLGGIPGLGWAVSLAQSLSGGDHTIARAAMPGVGDDPWRAEFASAYRGVYDLADPDSSVFITATGQSGHPLSRHYDDLSERWRRGEYIGMSLDPQLARAAAVGITRLIPAAPPPR